MYWQKVPRERMVGNFRGTTFCFLLSLLFCVFLLFVGYGIWGVVFHGMSKPKSNVGGGALLFKFLLFGDA
jgi:phosphotransferase system  glucose/maltose/N-acetylglucosamine-specific IIC component